MSQSGAFLGVVILFAVGGAALSLDLGHCWAFLPILLILGLVLKGSNRRRR